MATPKLLTYFKTIKSNSSGLIQLTGIEDVKSFSTVNMEIINHPKQSFSASLKVDVSMGKLSGTTLGQNVGSFTPSAKIRSYPVIGPEMSVYIKGAPANTNVNVQAWVFMH